MDLHVLSVLAGLVSDEEVARGAGTTEEVVASYRVEHGIPAHAEVDATDWIESRVVSPEDVRVCLDAGLDVPLAIAVRVCERAHIVLALRAHGGHRQRSARALGISRKALWEKMVKYAITDAELSSQDGG